MAISAPHLSVTWTGASRQELLVEFELAFVPKREQFAQLENLVSHFVTAGRYGAFPRENVSPAESSLHLTSANLSLPLHPTFVLTGEELDPRAFRLLHHMVWKWSSRGSPLAATRVSDRTAGRHASVIQIPDATWTTEYATYPPASSRLRTRVERDDPGDYQKERRCVVEGGRPLPAARMNDVIERLRTWYLLVNAGAYGPPVKPSPEAEVLLENLAGYDEYSVELALYLFEASEAAWDTLLNSLEHYSLTVEPLALVTVA
jgi:hypothetical protein